VGKQLFDQVQTPGAEPVGVRASTPVAAGLNETPYAWFVVLALALTNMVAFLERQIVTLLYGPIKADFGISDTQVSLLSGMAFILFATVFGLFFGRLADRKSRKWIITLGVVAWSAATMACGLARSFTQLFVARISVGVGEATLGPSAMSMISDYFPRHRLARGMSVYTSSVAAGAGLALVAGGAAIQFVGGLPPLSLPGSGPLATWQMTFVLVGAVGLLVLIPLSFVKEPVRRGTLAGAPAAKPLPISEVAGHLRRQWRFYLLHCAGFSLATILAAGTVAWIPTFFIRHHGWAPHQIGYAYGLIVAVCGVVGVLAGARVAEWMDARGCKDTNVRLPLIAMALATIPAILTPLVPSPYVALGLLALGSLVGSLATAPIWTALQVVTPNQMRGQVVAMFSFVVNIVGMGIGPLVVALITDYVFRDEAKLGLSIVVASLVLKPLILLIFWLCLRGYRESLTAYDAMIADGRPA
jgi:MFS family permease